MTDKCAFCWWAKTCSHNGKYLISVSHICYHFREWTNWEDVRKSLLKEPKE